MSNDTDSHAFKPSLKNIQLLSLPFTHRFTLNSESIHSGYWKACPEINKFYFLSICTCKKNWSKFSLSEHFHHGWEYRKLVTFLGQFCRCFLLSSYLYNLWICFGLKNSLSKCISWTDSPMFQIHLREGYFSHSYSGK